MKIGVLELINFRSYQKRSFEFENLTIIEGNNGIGKSNLLEAIYLLATGKSFRADRDDEMIRYGQIMATVKSMGIEVFVADRKRFEVNGVPRRMMDAVGKVKAVLFGPADMEIVTGSPGVRRRYLDFILIQKDREYRRCLVSYEKGVRQRNKILGNIREGIANKSQLFFWDKLLIKDGGYITDKREEYIEFLGERIVYDKSVISEMRLKQYEVEEVAAATTLVGPHRDDFTILFDDKDVSKYGSRGEQRMAVWWMKMKELEILSEDGDMPILLLDDVFSELDHYHRDEIISVTRKLITDGGQVIMTTADKHLIPQIEGSKLIEL